MGYFAVPAPSLFVVPVFFARIALPLGVLPYVRLNVVPVLLLDARGVAARDEDALVPA